MEVAHIDVFVNDPGRFWSYYRPRFGMLADKQPNPAHRVLARLVDALTSHRIAYAQTFRDEMRELSAILNPVQRGQYLMMRDRLMQRVQELQQGRTDPPPPAPFHPNRRP